MIGGGGGLGVLIAFAAGGFATVGGLVAGADFVAGEAFAAGDGLVTGVAFIMGDAEGDAFGVGEADSVTGFSTFTDDEAISFHSLFRLANVSTKRY